MLKTAASIIQGTLQDQRVPLCFKQLCTIGGESLFVFTSIRRNVSSTEPICPQPHPELSSEVDFSRFPFVRRIWWPPSAHHSSARDYSSTFFKISNRLDGIKSGCCCRGGKNIAHKARRRVLERAGKIGGESRRMGVCGLPHTN